MSDAFAEALRKVKSVSKTPSTEELLQLYAFYKQGTEGDISGKRPGMLDMKGRAKYDAWTKAKGLSQEQAKAKYVAFVEGLLANNP